MTSVASAAKTTQGTTIDANATPLNRPALRTPPSSALMTKNTPTQP